MAGRRCGFAGDQPTGALRICVSSVGAAEEEVENRHSATRFREDDCPFEGEIERDERYFTKQPGSWRARSQSSAFSNGGVHEGH
jgi:hypothetical protein